MMCLLQPSDLQLKLLSLNANKLSTSILWHFFELLKYSHVVGSLYELAPLLGLQLVNAHARADLVYFCSHQMATNFQHSFYGNSLKHGVWPCSLFGYHL